MSKGYFIVLEGIDGTGKSTHARKLGEYLEGKGYEVSLTAEPTSGVIGQLIRMVLGGKIEMDPYALALLFTADRMDHNTKLIKPALDAGKIVICERYFYSTLAYQSAQGLSLQWLRDINSNAIEPDLAILMDLKPEEAFRRLKHDREIFEELEFQKRVYLTLLGFAYGRVKGVKFSSKERSLWKIVDVTEEEDKVQEKLREVVNSKLSQ